MGWEDYPPPGLVDGRTTEVEDPDAGWTLALDVHTPRPMVEFLRDHPPIGWRCGKCDNGYVYVPTVTGGSEWG